MHSQPPVTQPRRAAKPRPAGSGAPTTARTPSRTHSVGTALLWGGAGFIVGAVFWHLIGFWDFMTAVILGHPESRRQDAASAWSTQVIAQPIPGRTTRRPPPTSSCSTIAMDRANGSTMAKPCPAIIPTAPATVAEKADRLQPSVVSPQQLDAAESATATAIQAPTGPNLAIQTSSTKNTAPLPGWQVETSAAKPD